MKSIRLVILSVLLTAGGLFAVLYSSCTKDSCKGVTCLNAGTCTGGICTCPAGVGGASCETVYRNNYMNTYLGNGSASGAADTTNLSGSTVTFSSSDSVLTKLSVAIHTNDSTIPSSFSADLVTNTATGSTYTLSSVTVDSFTFTGTGAVSATQASLNLVKTKTTGAVTTYTFSSLIKQ